MPIIIKTGKSAKVGFSKLRLSAFRAGDKKEGKLFLRIEGGAKTISRLVEDIQDSIDIFQWHVGSREGYVDIPYYSLAEMDGVD